MTEAVIIQKPDHWFAGFLYDNGLRHEGVKHEQCYDLKSKMSWHSDFKSFTDKLFPL